MNDKREKYEETRELYVAFGQKIHDAVVFASRAHHGQYRKGTDIDYISHPMEVMQILTEMNASIDVQIAGALHDTVEDTDVTEQDIRDRFGDRVAELVMHHTEDKSLGWKERKSHALREAASNGRDVEMLVLADRVSNLRSMYADWKEIGDKLWDRFAAGKEMQKWYTEESLETFRNLEKDPDCGKYVDELREYAERMF